jgi:glycosyltransferase involved in cell wall biosynthesis
MNKKSVLLVSDTKKWGGWKRAQMIKKYLEDEFDFVLMDSESYNNFERMSTINAFSKKDVNRYINNKMHGNDPDFMDINHFNKWLNDQKKQSKKFDLIYFLFHTMLIKKSTKRTLERGNKVITMVTVYPTLRPIFMSGKSKEMAISNFRNLTSKCKAILANNELSLKDLRKIYNGPTFLAPRGVDPKVFFPTRNVFEKKPEAKFTIAFCGKANPEKGLESIIKPACREANVKLITNERNFENALPEDKMNEFYNSADAYIVASTMDGTPNTALEAASCGKPILSNEIGNMPEFIKQGENGWLVKLKVSKYSHRLKWMKKNQRKVYEMGLKARKTILKDWTWEKVINNNERKIFREVINGM